VTITSHHPAKAGENSI